MTSIETHFAEVTICNTKGLHARASAEFVKCAEKFDAKIDVTRSGETVPGTSIMGLMLLAASQGSTILIEASGVEAKAAIDALISLIEAKFRESD